MCDNPCGVCRVVRRGKMNGMDCHALIIAIGTQGFNDQLTAEQHA